MVTRLPRRHFVSPPHKEWDYQYVLHVQCDWAKNCSAARMTTVASCPTKESIEAATRLLTEEGETT